MKKPNVMLFFKKKKKAPKVYATDITEATFKELVTDSDIPVIIDFWAGWCGPCKVLVPIFNEIANENQDKPVRIAKINIDQNPNIARHFMVKSIPTVVIVENQKEIYRHAGIVPKPNLQELVDQLVSTKPID